MNSISRISFDSRKVNFKSNEGPDKYQYVYAQQPPKKDTFLHKINEKRKQVSIGQILGIATSLVVVTYFGMLLHNDFAAKLAQRKLAGKLDNAADLEEVSWGEIISKCKDKNIIRALKEELAKGLMMSSKKIQALKELAQIPETNVKEIDIAEAARILDEEVIGMQGVKKQILEFLEYRNECIKKGIKPDKPLVISLDGPAGTAKTTLAGAVAKATGLPHKEISMAGATGKAKIIGNEPVYTGASWGEFADAQLEYKTKNIVYTLDELEKTGTSDHNGKVEDAILPLLDGRHKIKDDFLGVDIDISDSIVMITTNKFERLSEPLRDRISYKYKIAPYTLEEQADVAKFKFNKALNHHEIQDKVNVDENIFGVIAESVSDQGGREATDIAENIVHKIFILSNKQAEKIDVTPEMVRQWIKEGRRAV